MSEELKPCPFCGHKAGWSEGEQKTEYGNEQVYCRWCFANTAPEGSKKEAAEIWNTRVEPAELAQLRKELKAANKGAQTNALINQSLSNQLWELREKLAVAREAVMIFQYTCKNCRFEMDQHDEDGKVDMMDEMGRMVCGNPSYPCGEALAIIDGKENL